MRVVQFEIPRIVAYEALPIEEVAPRAGDAVVSLYPINGWAGSRVAAASGITKVPHMLSTFRPSCHGESR